MSDKQTITLTVRGKDLAFAPTVAAYNSYVNELMPDNKVAPAHNYLRRIVTPESKADLAELLALPGAAIQLAAKVNEQFTPDLEIEVKN